MKFIKSCSLVLSVLFVFSILSSIGYAEDGIVEVPEIKVIINGKNVTFKDVIISSKGRTLLPLRALLTDLGVQNDDEHIIWNSTEKSVTIIKDSTKVKLVQGNNLAYINDVPATLDVPPIGYSKNGRTYIPARFVAQSLGKVVDWDSNTKSVIINDPKFVTVDTAEELFASIDSNTTITLKSGVYNLSKLKQEYSEDSVFWEDVFDGNQLIIKGIKNLTLQGEGDTPAEIVVEPRYADVLSFRDSSNITIKNIIAGHTPEQGSCAGGVLTFDGCSNITILESDLYGCGIEGLTLFDTQFLMFANSTIYDCNTAIMTLDNSKNIDFYKSKFYDNTGYSYGIEARNNCSLVFEDCEFKNNQITDGFLFNLSLSKVSITNSMIHNNSFRSLASDTAALTIDNTVSLGNVSHVLWNKAIEFYNSGKYEDAIKYFDELITSNPDNYDAYTFKGEFLTYSRRYDEAIECYDASIKIYGIGTAYTYWSKGNTFYGLGKYSESISCYDEALKISPNYVDALNSKGDVLIVLGKLNEANQCYNQVLALDSGNIYAMCGQANILFYQLKYEEAIKEYDKIINLQPDFVTSYVKKGIALFRLGRYEKSLECFDKVIEELNPNDPSAYYEKAKSLVKLSRFSDAISNLKISIELLPVIKEYIESDTDFNSLRDMVEFKVLIQ